MALSSALRWVGGLAVQTPIDLLAYLIVPLAVKTSYNTGRSFDGFEVWELPSWAKWWDNPEPYGALGEPFWYKEKNWKSKEQQMRGWLLRNKAYGFRRAYVDPKLVNPEYRLWGDQYINKSTGRTGWLFAIAVCDEKLYWNFAAVLRVVRIPDLKATWRARKLVTTMLGYQPYMGWGFKRERPLGKWDTEVLADHSASILRFTTKLTTLDG